MKKGIEFSPTNELLTIAEKYMSNNNRIKCEKALKCFAKESKKQKDNDYVQARDLAVLGLVLLGLFKEQLPFVKTTDAGRKDLQDLCDEIFKANTGEKK